MLEVLHVLPSTGYTLDQPISFRLFDFRPCQRSVLSRLLSLCLLFQFFFSLFRFFFYCLRFLFYFFHEFIRSSLRRAQAIRKFYSIPLPVRTPAVVQAVLRPQIAGSRVYLNFYYFHENIEVCRSDGIFDGRFAKDRGHERRRRKFGGNQINDPQ